MCPMLTDKEIIAFYGGPAKLAAILNYEKQGGVQRIQNWLTRGIPAKVKLEHPRIFLSDEVLNSKKPRKKSLNH